MQFEFNNGKALFFKSLGYALEYAHNNGLKVVRQFN